MRGPTVSSSQWVQTLRYIHGLPPAARRVDATRLGAVLRALVIIGLVTLTVLAVLDSVG